MTGRIHSFESFGTVDGPGIRFVLFLQGCPLRCQYCHNPDTWAKDGGKEITVAEVLKHYAANAPFYKNGGITVTGGEPLLQIDFVTELFSAAKEKGIHTCIDTSGITFRRDNPQILEKFEKLLAVTDLVMLDIKHIDPEAHKVLTGTSNQPVLEFAKYLAEKGIPLWVRHVVVPTITDKEEDWKALGEFLATLPNLQALDVLPYHTLGVKKYEALGIDYPLKGLESLDRAEAVRARKMILAARMRVLKQSKENK